MKALFLCPNVPFPPVNGGQHRNLGLIHSLARVAAVRVLAIGDPREDRVTQARSALAEWGATLEVFQPTGPGRPEADEEDTARLPDAACHFRSPDLRDALGRLRETTTFDLAHVEEVVMAQYVDLLGCPRVLDRQKIDWAYHEAMAEVDRADAVAHLREAVRFRRWDSRLLGAFDQILVPGDGDRELIEPLYGRGAVSIVPIAIADDLRPPEGTTRGVEFALLYGAQDYAPNIEAQAWFFREVWPELSRRAPTLKAMMVGSGRPPVWAPPPPSDPRVEVRGFVPDIRSVLQAPGVLVVAVRVGGGARTKILEALACGMPVVSTAVGVENLGLVPGEDFLLAETRDEVIGAIVRLSEDPVLAVSLGRKAAVRAEGFRWSRVDQVVAPIFRNVAARGASGRATSDLRPAMPGWWEAEIRRCEAAITDRNASAGGRAGQSFARWRRHLRDRALASGTGRRATRFLDRLLTPSAGSGRRERLRRLLAGWLARVARRG